MSASADSPFDVCLSEALVLSRGWVPRWLGDLHAAIKDREFSASQLSDKQVLRFANMVDLYRIKGVGSEYAELLEAAGVDTVPALARRSPGSEVDPGDTPRGEIVVE